MSDDEYYYDPDYDDFHDMLYDADPAPDLADDLAEHAAYSPVWQDDVTEELRDYFSDWEYYSDDYFDDDPALLNVAKGGSAGFKSGQKIQQPAKRGRKRKLSAARENPRLETKELDALTACLQGTVWKSRSPGPAVDYVQSVEGPVALRLSNEIMRSAYNKKHGFGKGRLNKDESWANDLSLADMGLKAERTVSTNDHADLEEDVDEEHGNEEVGDYADEEEDKIDEVVVEAETMVREPYRVEIQSELATIESAIIQDEIDEGRTPRKKRKLSTPEAEATTRNALPTPDGSLGSDPVEAAMEEEAQSPEQLVKRGRGRPRKAEPASTKLGMLEEQEPKKTSGPGRKRKLSAGESDATGSTASSRAKKVDTKTTSHSRPAVTTVAATRSSRKRKK